MTLDEARVEMLLHLDAISGTVGSEWIDRYEPATFQCSTTGDRGLQWTAVREGSIDGTARSAAVIVADYFRENGFDVRLRNNSPSDIDVIARSNNGLDIQFGAVDAGFAYASGQSVCVAE